MDVPLRPGDQCRCIRVAVVSLHPFPRRERDEASGCQIFVNQETKGLGYSTVARPRQSRARCVFVFGWTRGWSWAFWGTSHVYHGRAIPSVSDDIDIFMPPMDSVDTMLTSILRLSRVQTGKPSHERPVSDRNPMFQSWTPGPNIGGPDSSHRPGPFVQRVTPPSDVAKRNETKRDRLVGSGDRLVGTEKRRRPRRNRTRWFGRATRWGEDGARSELGVGHVRFGGKEAEVLTMNLGKNTRIG